MSDSFATEKERLLDVIVSFGFENNRLKAENGWLREALEKIASLRNLNPTMKETHMISCAEDSFRNFYCKMGDIANKALMKQTEEDGENGKKRVIVEVEKSDGKKVVFTVPYSEKQESMEYETNMPEFEKK